MRRCRQSRQHRDHPRRCGENPRHHQTRGQSIGSPPQVRGKLSLIENLPTIIRITPAGAGKTLVTDFTPATGGDHPRRCGENLRQSVPRDFGDGSPPQVRGKPCSRCVLLFRCGITPAGAGKTDSILSFSMPIADHPRRCGENSPSSGLRESVLGSPPQVRGKHWSKLAEKPVTGITPAGAGKTAIRTTCTMSHGDHPRRCGENRGCTHGINTIMGSPPQVRGKPATAAATAAAARITPAGAGKTTSNR